MSTRNGGNGHWKAQEQRIADGLRFVGLFGTTMLLGLLIASGEPPRALASGGPTVSIDSVALTVEASAPVDLQALNIAAPGLGSWSVDVTYDSTVLSVVHCSVGVGSGVCNPNFAPDTVRSAGAAATGLEGDLALAIMRFRCIHVGTSNLTITIKTLADATTGAPQEISASIRNGGVTCTAPTPTPTFTPTATPTPSRLVGDVSCNGVVNAIDAFLLLQFVAGVSHSLPCLPNADVNGDGRITAVDAQLILQYVAGLIHTLPP